MKLSLRINKRNRTATEKHVVINSKTNSCVIGSYEADILIKESQKMKARVLLHFRRDEKLCLIDLEGTEATLVNGKKVNRSFLRTGDKFVLGSHKVTVVQVGRSR